jgi:hypothetical protein
MAATNVNTDTLEIQVVTTSGNFPAQGFESFNSHQPLRSVLNQADAKLKLHNTTSWIAKLGERELSLDKSLADNSIPDNSQIFWGPTERGGGAGR